MGEQIYNAFVEAGFGNEANKLSETVRTNSGLKRRTGLGHYIVVLDDLSSREVSVRESSRLDNARERVMHFLYNNSDRIKDSGLKNDLDGILVNFNLGDNLVDVSFLDKFVKHYQTKQN